METTHQKFVFLAELWIKAGNGSAISLQDYILRNTDQQ